MYGRQSYASAMGSNDSMRKDNIASTLILQDHLKGMLLKSQNTNYKPWRNSYAPKNPHSPFGDFPKSHLSKVSVNLKDSKLDQSHEKSYAPLSMFI